MNSCIFLLVVLACHVKRISAQISICDIVYIDLGSNDGETIRNFIHKNAETSLRSILLNDFHLMMDRACVIGFEPNPRWTKSLEKLQQDYHRNVSSLLIHTNTAAIPTDAQSVDLNIDKSSKNVGSSIYAKRTSVMRRANAIRLSNFLEKYLSRIHGKPVILIRMYIEGYEYELIPELVTSGVLKNYKTYYVIEWHRYLKKINHVALDEHMRNFNRAQHCTAQCSSI
jgi:FkbM family methyltransferase